MSHVTQGHVNGLQFGTQSYSFVSMFMNNSQDRESRLRTKKMHGNPLLSLERTVCYKYWAISPNKARD